MRDGRSGRPRGMRLSLAPFQADPIRSATVIDEELTAAAVNL